ncbi:porin [Comamonas endophytica]|uniref:Porin n=1 Tax=Comamonas endophytica TaxID=2949090 RepID=A0ABY6GDU5_9BURK|nr:MULTISPECIES: porin [unclassified Acidovorax]MCD2512790.1 porin [Acidovorax sp. D4N7]UYG52860.1 porin [Acidovorax sp. 5MLIR]
MKQIQLALLAAVAIAGTSAALAQSSVSLYGRVNTTLEQQKNGSTKLTGMFNNSSRFGLRGSEDLGGGLKAGFQIESGFSSDTGVSDPVFFRRQSELNLGGDFGLLRLGNFTAESYNTTLETTSLHNHDTGSSADVLYTYVMRDINKIAYRLPALGAFNAEGAVSLAEKEPGAHNAYDLALVYGAGPVGLSLGYSRNKGATGIFGTYAGEAQQAALRASYALGGFKLGAYYQYATVGNANNGTADAKRHAVRLAAMYSVGASEFHANFGRADKVKLGGSKLGGTAANQWTLGYNHNLSKRTKLYGYFTRIDHGANINYLGGTPGADFRSVAVGVRHNF